MADIRSISYEDMADVTTSDATKQWGGAKPAAGFMCDVAGTVRFMTARGSTHTRTVNAGVIYPIAAQQFWATGTGASNIVALASRPYSGVGT